MCGICGELTFRGQAASEQRINNMLVHLERRGPDDQGVYIDNQVGLGHRRLSIIDLSAASHQPMHNSNKTVSIVFNGTIYNYPQLRKQLQAQGVQFSSSGDTEVILKAYEAWGEQCVDKLIGMFAFAIWDQRRQKLFVARDRLGIKPFYYSQTNESFLFASNTQALLATGDVDTSIDTQALQHQFTLHAVVPAPRTILNGIRKLPPGHFMWIDANGVSESKAYWKLSARRTEKRDEQEWWKKFNRHCS